MTIAKQFVARLRRSRDELVHARWLYGLMTNSKGALAGVVGDMRMLNNFRKMVVCGYGEDEPANVSTK